MSILLAEDNPLILKSLAYTFSHTKLDVHCAIDGLQAKEIYDRVKPSFVISDLMMPFLTGLELIEHIRDTEVEYTKIIVLSSMKMEDTISHAFDMGVDDFVTKPFASSELIARVKRLLKYYVVDNFAKSVNVA